MTLKMTVFTLVEPVPGSWCFACWLTIMAYWDALTKRISFTCGFLLWQMKMSAVKNCLLLSFAMKAELQHFCICFICLCFLYFYISNAFPYADAGMGLDTSLTKTYLHHKPVCDASQTSLTNTYLNPIGQHSCADNPWGSFTTNSAQ